MKTSWTLQMRHWGGNSSHSARSLYTLLLYTTSTPSSPQMRALHCRLALTPNASVWGFSRSQPHSSPQTRYHERASFPFVRLCRRPPLSRIWSKGGSLLCSKSETMGVSLFANRRSLATDTYPHCLGVAGSRQSPPSLASSSQRLFPPPFARCPGTRHNVAVPLVGQNPWVFQTLGHSPPLSAWGRQSYCHITRYCTSIRIVKLNGPIP